MPSGSTNSPVISRWGLTALATGYIAARYGLRPTPIYLGIVYPGLGLALSVLLVRDTRAHVALEAKDGATETGISFREVFALTTFKDRNLFAASQAGLVNNLNDGMSWRIFPLFYSAFGLGVERIGNFEGALSDGLGAAADRDRTAQ